MNKYRNKKVVIDGYKFDSKVEGNRYLELKLMLRAGVIKDLRMQVSFELIPKQQGERACTYKADFVYTDIATGKQVVEDVKSEATKTPEYRIKRKLMLWVHGIRVVEIMY